MSEHTFSIPIPIVEIAAGIRTDHVQPKLRADVMRVFPILQKAARGESLDTLDCVQLVTAIHVSTHAGGKIAGIASIDASAVYNPFCARMRKAAAADQSIICGHCYACAGKMAWDATQLRHLLNTAILSATDYSVDELRVLGLAGLVRFNSDGDAANDTHARNLLRIAWANPYARIGWWTKNIPAVQRAISAIGKPANLVLIASTVKIDGAHNLPSDFDYTFTVYGRDSINAAIAAGACVCNGRKCRDCGYKCYMGTWQHGANIAEVLR